MITIQNLNYHYQKRYPIFRDLALQLEPGNIYGLLGKNGAGKTTLLKLMTGLLFPKEGQISVMGYQPSQRLPEFLSDIYIIPEEMYVPNIKIGTYEKLYAPFYPRFDHETFEQHLKEFGIDRNRHLQGLSYGQKKKALLSFGLAANCRLLILDEPTNGLDIPSKSQFRKLLAASITDEKCFVISTHQVRDMTNLIDPLIVLEDGKILFHESLEEVSRRLYFSVQYRDADLQDALYSERTPGGHLIVTENQHGEDSEVDLEVLFNAIVSNKQKIQQIFKKEVPHEA